LYTASFYPFETQEERWAYWAKHIAVNRYDPPATDLYKKLFQLARDKDHFVLTTNVEYQFHKAGFADENVFMVQGNYGYFQCEKGCHQKVYDNEEQVKTMIAHTRDCRIPTFLIPKCPVCGGEMDAYVHHSRYFVRDEHWDNADKRYQAFLKRSKKKRIVYLELGVGFNTPGIIRYPFEQLTYQNGNATLIRINRDFPHGEKENTDRTIAFAEDMTEIMSQIIPDSGGQKPVSINKVMEVRHMKGYYAPKSAQGYMNTEAAYSAMGGSACGAGDEKPVEKPSACGSSCGAGDEQPKPSACGAGDGK